MNPALSKLLRSHYLALKGYISAGMLADKSDDKIYLNANENPYPLPGLEGYNRYPEPQPAALREAYARAYGVNYQQVVMTRGADEAISVLTKLFCEPHRDKILVCPPTFGMYAVNANASPAAGIVEVPLLREGRSFKLDKDAIIERASDPLVKLVYLCSPNNPTGGSVSHEDISEICEALEGKAVIILDETYAEFSEAGSMCADLESTPNMIILRTLSKSYALAGLRMGCMLCGDEEFAALVRAKGLDAYPLSRASIEAAFHALSPEIRTIAHENIKKILAERVRMEQELPAMPGVKCVYESDANFLLVEMEDAAGFCKFAAENDVLLRDFSAYKGTENCLRLSIGTPEQNDLVLDLLRRYAVKAA